MAKQSTQYAQISAINSIPDEGGRRTMLSMQTSLLRALLAKSAAAAAQVYLLVSAAFARVVQELAAIES